MKTFLKEQFLWARQILCEANGQPSSQRVIVLVCGVPAGLAPTAVWTYLSMHTSSMVEFPASVSEYFKWLLVILLAAKVAQKSQEAKATPAPTQ